MARVSHEVPAWSEHAVQLRYFLKTVQQIVLLEGARRVEHDVKCSLSERQTPARNVSQSDVHVRGVRCE
eukprot:CAMPEP_0183335530 /NCGR_PEP_ID=MMETSP0164_2-20130417/3807_1 /TAXON_ID=221442 /ORGANISM="Coccolithus pelagicus ssp braarudi, Strain PLY182g" /LENGTH=68 /DNA_ID=CAMNT_0025504917 /DNA_START=1584 /DNA_END=1790 /DNA_ORIENTATION=+